MGIFNIFKKTSKLSAEDLFLNLVKNSQASYRLHCASMRGDDDSYDREANNAKHEHEKSLIKLQEKLFPEHCLHVFHGSCLSCKAPKKLGVMICNSCAIANHNDNLEDYSVIRN
jgi:hypothetical protein